MTSTTFEPVYTTVAEYPVELGMSPDTGIAIDWAMPDAKTVYDRLSKAISGDAEKGDAEKGEVEKTARARALAFGEKNYLSYEAATVTDAEPETKPEDDPDRVLKRGTRLRTEPYIRPNGEAYGPRMISGLGVYDVQLIEQAYEDRIPVLLYGPPGTGKTALVDAVLTNLITVSGSADTEVADFLGSYVQNPDGTFSWVDGPLLKAMDEGRPLFIDEVAMIDPRVMSIVYSTMDGRGELHVTVNPARGTVKAADGFYVIAACNPDVPGAVMSEALLSRFAIQLEVLTDFDLAKRLGVSSEIMVLARNLARKKASNEIMRAPQMREILQYTKFEKRYGRQFALSNLISCSEPADREVITKTIQEVFSDRVSPLVVGE